MAKILVVDDEEQIRDMLVDMLELDDHQVETASDGEQGIKRLDDSFDLLITDIIMPNKTGFELIEFIKPMIPDLPIVVISGGGTPNSGASALDRDKLGVAGVLSKPFRGSELKSLLDDLLQVKA